VVEVVNLIARQGRFIHEWRFKLGHNICDIWVEEHFSALEKSLYKDAKATFFFYFEYLKKLAWLERSSKENKPDRMS
jgi:hypothetical protein